MRARHVVLFMLLAILLGYAGGRKCHGTSISQMGNCEVTTENS